jgi:hypothetical protein
MSNQEHGAGSNPELEAEKLRLEIDTLKRSQKPRYYWTSVKPNEWIVAIAAVVALGTAYFTGLFDATRQNLEAKRERLTIEVRELEALKVKLLPIQQEEEAINRLRQLGEKGLYVRFALASPQFDGLQLAISGPSDYHFDRKPTPTRNPLIRDALEAANRLRILRELRIAYLTLTPDELKLALQHPSLEHLAIQFADLDSDSLKDLPAKWNLKSLDLSVNKISSVEHLPRLESLVYLSLAHNNVRGASLQQLATKCPTLFTINLNYTNITDAEFQQLKNHPRLAFLELRRTQVTSKGFLELAEFQNPLNKRTVTLNVDTAPPKEILDKLDWKAHFQPEGDGPPPAIGPDWMKGFHFK